MRVVSLVCRHFTVFCAAMELEQFKRGLEVLDVLQLMEKNPTQFMKAFRSHEKLTVEVIDSFYAVQYSEVGCNLREREELIMFNWFQFLRDVEQGLCIPHYFILFSHCINVCLGNVGEDIALEKVFRFLTGCDQIPPIGYPDARPVIRFDEKLQLPRISTCAFQLVFPMNMATSYEEFKERMAEYIEADMEFGLL